MEQSKKGENKMGENSSVTKSGWADSLKLNHNTMKDKITIADFENLCADPVIKNAAKDFYELHLQALQQILEEAGEELPDVTKWREFSKSNRIEWAVDESKETYEWMRSEASKVVAGYKKRLAWQQAINRGFEDDVKLHQKEIQQLREELARKDEAYSKMQVLDMLEKMRINLGLYGLYQQEHCLLWFEKYMNHQAQKTDKP